MTIEERLTYIEKRLARVEKLVIRGDQQCGYMFCPECHEQFEPSEAPSKHCGQKLEPYEVGQKLEPYEVGQKLEPYEVYR